MTTVAAKPTPLGAPRRSSAPTQGRTGPTLAKTVRYVLLLFSRTEALSPTAVAWSDSLVWFGGWASVAGVVASGLLSDLPCACMSRANSAFPQPRVWRMKLSGWTANGSPGMSSLPSSPHGVVGRLLRVAAYGEGVPMRNPLETFRLACWGR